jgi:hypothetical protein
MQGFLADYGRNFRQTGKQAAFRSLAHQALQKTEEKDVEI